MSDLPHSSPLAPHPRPAPSPPPPSAPRAPATSSTAEARGGDPRCYHRRAMSDRPRFYLTTAIAYANNAPGLHTVYEVIGADVVARWHRMQGHETRFLTGTDEHSVNIAQSAEPRA